MKERKKRVYIFCFILLSVLMLSSLKIDKEEHLIFNDAKANAAACVVYTGEVCGVWDNQLNCKGSDAPICKVRNQQ